VSSSPLLLPLPPPLPLLAPPLPLLAPPLPLPLRRQPPFGSGPGVIA
jgi:hypothetical protein